MKLSLAQLLLGGAAVRALLIFYGLWQDEVMVVKYTDVDYKVYSDAAAAVQRGGSPFERATYRYTPLLAWALVPNELLFASFGKWLFAAIDLAVATLLWRILRHQGERHAALWTAAWVFNPIAINVSTRGNADSIVCLLILACALLLLEKRLTTAALFYGLAVHMRIFPVFFGPSILLFIDDAYCGRSSAHHVFLQARRERLWFFAVSTAVFFGLAGVLYVMYGWDFLYEAYIYHLVRTDNRHNFSVYFYSLYLQYGQPAGFLAGLGAFLPQIVVQASASLAFHQDIVFCMCLQTLAFVAFNKVCTAQYFSWYACLLPVALPSLKGELRARPLGVVGVAWLLAMLNWLYWAYRLEFKGDNTFFQVWVAGIAFFVASVASIGCLSLAKNRQLALKTKPT